MSKLYLEGILPALQPTCVEFDRLCREYDIPYIIVEDSPTKQSYRLGKSEPRILKAIKEYADQNSATVNGNEQDISVLAGDCASKKCFVAVIDDDIQSKMMEAVIHYMGSRHNRLINESFKELEVPTRMVDTEALWQTHMDHPRWMELGDRKNMYADRQADYPPVVTDSVIQDPIKHSGVLVDGFRRLYRAHANRESKIEAMDIADIIKEYQTRLEQSMNEDQYKSPTRKMIRKQSAHPSSFEPSKSFGGIDGYSKYSKKKMDECYQGEIGKISKDLLAHDNKTVIPAGAVIRVVDADEGLPDVWYDGRIINVDRAKLEEVWKPTSFANQLETLLMAEEESKTNIAPEGSELEDKLSSAFGGTISIVEPEILFTITPKRNENV
jgi:hypothetical protein